MKGLLSAGFMHDQLEDGRIIRLFNVIADFNREELGIEIALPMPPECVVGVIKQIISWRGKPATIRCDNDPGNMSDGFRSLAEKRGIRMKYLQPGNHQQNAYLEQFNGTWPWAAIPQSGD